MTLPQSPLPILPEYKPKPKAPIKPIECQKCSLETLGGPTWSSPEGKCTNRVMMIGESLGDKEQEDGLPFRPRAQAGSVLERAIKRLGMDRQQFGLWNLVGCRPPGNQLDRSPWEISAIHHCQGHFRKVVEMFQPKVMLALGGLPLAYLTGMHGGEKLGISMLRGYVLDGKGLISGDPFDGVADGDPICNGYGIPVIGTYHPSYIARKGEISAESKTHVLLGVMIRDIALALQVAQSGVKRTAYRSGYQINPSREYIENIIKIASRHPEWIIYWDVETIDSLSANDESELSVVKQMTQFQFQLSGMPGEAIVMDWAEPYIQLIRRVMSLPNVKAGWNVEGFDIPVARDHQIPIIGHQLDLMWKWHFWQPDLPKGLQYVTSFYNPFAQPWKHIHSSDAGNYGGDDVNHLQTIDEGLSREMTKKSMLSTYERLIWQHSQIVLRPCEIRGIPVNRDKLIKFGDRLEIMKLGYLGEMQSLVPEDMKGCSPKNGYVREPRDLKGLVIRKFSDEMDVYVSCPQCNGIGRIEISKEPTRRQKTLDPLAPNRLVSKRCPGCKGKGKTKSGKSIQEIERYCKIENFSPSSQQLIRYIQYRKHPVPTHIDTGRDTTGQKELEKLARRYPKEPMYKLVLEYRKTEKLKGTYVDGFIPASDGGVHCRFTNSPATLQLAAVNPNVLTLPKRSDLAADFRECIEAHDGYTLIEADFSSFHAKTLGRRAKDSGYMALAALDIHSFVAAHGLKIPEAPRLYDLAMHHPEEYAEIIARYRKDETKLYAGKTFGWRRDFVYKQGILGIGFGLGPHKLWMQNSDVFANKREATELQGLIKGLFPKIFKFQSDVCLQAYRDGRLVNSWNAHRWFWDVYHWDPQTQSLAHGEDVEAAIAYLPASDAHGMFRDVQMRMQSKGWMERYGFFLPYHDAVYMHCRDGLVDECVHNLKSEMERPVMEMMDPEVCPNGFICGVEVKVGKNLKEQKKFKFSF